MSTVYEVTMEGKEPYTVDGDQRDLVAYEMHYSTSSHLAGDTGLLKFIRYCAWNASRRNRGLKQSWEKFNEECVHVKTLRTGGVELDPTNLDQHTEG